MSEIPVQSNEIIADVPMEMEMSAVVVHKSPNGDIELEIEDIEPKTFRERLALHRAIIRYNRLCKADCDARGIEFGDENTPYHFWQANWRKVVRG
jgi:hypothetical protein